MSRRQLGGSGCFRRNHDCLRSSGDCAAVATGQIIPSSRALLQWEAIVDDPIGALAAVQLIIGLVVSIAAGVASGYGIAQALRRGWVPEYMKVPVLFTVLICVFVGSNAFLYESGLLAVTIMGVWIANANLPSYEELRRFKEHAMVLLVSGVFVLLVA